MMGAIKVLVVDDSPFSRTLITDVLQENGFQIVGEADSLDKLMMIYRQCQPDIVTMDIAMPDADGFECSKALRLYDPKAKIVLVSAMKDEETEAEARRIGVSGYIQKPVDGEVITRIINNIMTPDALYQKLYDKSLETFKEALAQNVTRMTKSPVIFEDETIIDHKFVSQGNTAVIGITGRNTGTMLLDLSTESAEKMAEVVLRRPANSQKEVLAMVSEFTNIVAGVACSLLNKMDKSFSLRVSPPSLFYGAPAEIASPSIQVRGVYAQTDFGRIFLGVGFKKGSVLWM
jgi:DNA-binding NarL/FixJ family response regulator